MDLCQGCGKSNRSCICDGTDFNLVKARTLGSQSDQGKWIEVQDDKGDWYRMDVNDLLKVMKRSPKFKVEQKRVHKHLTVGG